MNFDLIIWIAWIVAAIMFGGRILGAVCATIRVQRWIRKHSGGLVFDGADNHIFLPEPTPLKTVVVKILSVFCGAKGHHIVTVVDENGKPRMYVDGNPCRRMKDKVFGSRWYFSGGCWIKTNK